MVPLETGILIGDRFQLQERVGDGGHAEIWAAWDTLKQQRVALKFLHPDLCATHEALAVLRHEAQMAQRLTHPGVLRASDPQSDGKRIFLPMEYAAGGDLKRLRGASYLQTVPVLLAVARILAHAHAQGVVHRDIKPGNVLFDAEEKVRLADFGTSALAGSALSLAPGSPFTASPQQLAGAPASPSDDIYGLGALAYELLSGYPPYYPDFDPVRVQSQMPPPVRPVEPAPERLTRLVMQMLARDPAERPHDMETVIEVLDDTLADTLSVDDDEPGIIIEPPPPYMAAEPRVLPVRSRRRTSLWLPALGILLFAGGAFALYVARGEPVVIGDRQILPAPSAFLPAARAPDPQAPAVAEVPSGAGSPEEQVAATMPVAPAAPDVSDPGDVATVTPPDAPEIPQAPGEEPPQSVAADTPAPDGDDDAAPPATPEQLAARAREAAVREQFDREIEAGRVALTRGQAALARSAFERARVLQPRAAEVTLGMDAVERLERVLAQHSQGLRAETAGQLSMARERFSQALLIDPGFAPARDGKARVEQRMNERERAEAQRLDEAGRAERNARDQRVGQELEAAERWRDAETLYVTAHDRDSGLAFAREGLERSRQRAAFSDQLDDFIERSSRLSDAGVRRAAEQALAAGRAIEPAGPKLTSQLDRLSSLLASYDVVARLEIISDSNTRIAITRVGDLGTFSSRHVNLPPGRYVVTGTREGYRDVRREIDIAPGQRAVSIAVECTERI